MKNNKTDKRTVSPLVIKASVLSVKTSILMLLLLLIGCGNKGDLYLPEKQQPEQEEQID